MFKTILVHLSGTQTDDATLSTAYQIARLFDGHMVCLRVRPDTSAMLGQAAGAAMAPSVALAEMLEMLRRKDAEQTEKARRSFDRFVEREDVARADTPSNLAGVTAAWVERSGTDLDELIAMARFNDVTVAARKAKGRPGLSPVDLGSVALKSGRPLVIAPPAPPKKIAGTIALAWKNCPEAARAAAAALPLFAKAKKVVVLSANEASEKALECLDCEDSVMSSLRWHGVKTEGRYVVPGGRPIPDAILETAKEAGADLLVTGAYGHSRLRELVFGGFTRRVLEGADLPVFLFH